MSDNMDDGRDRDVEKLLDDIISYKSKIVGVTLEGRQEVIGLLQGDEPLQVRREPENKYDPRAVAVDAMIAETWKPIGYIAKDKNKSIQAALDAGGEVDIGIASITGGNDKSYGVNVSISYTKIKGGAKVKSKVETPQKASQELTEAVNSELALLDSIRSLLGVKREVKKYTSRLIGKSTKVESVNGHVRLEGYLSGSAFPNQFYREFDQAGFLEKIISAYYKGAEPDETERIKKSILEMWNLNREASTGYGNAVHAALENYDTFHKLGDKTRKVEKFKTKPDEYGPNKSLSKNPFLKKIVEDFHEKFGGDYIRLNEQFVWLHDEKLCGSIDRVKIVDADKKIVRIQDFKTDGDIHTVKYQNADSPYRGVGKKALGEGKKQKPNVVEDTLLGLHWLQLSFYAYILKAYGYTVEGLDVYWLNPTKLINGENAWEEFSHEVIDVSKEIKERE